MERSDLDRWVEQGLITIDQRDAIARFEQDRAAHTPRAASALVEVLIYLGVAAGVGAVIAGMSKVWEDASSGSQALILAIVGVFTGAAGWSIRGDDGAPARAAAALQLVSVGLIAGAAAVFVDGASLMRGDGSGTHVLVIGAVATGAAIVHLARRAGALQLVTAVAAVSTLAVGVVTAFTSPSQEHLTAALVIVGAGVAAARAAGLARPARTAQWLAPALVLLGLHLSAWSGGGTWAEAVGIIASVAVLGWSVAARSTGVLAIGSIGLFTFVPGVIMKHLADSIGAPLALLATAMVLIGAGVVIARVRPQSSR